MVASQMAGARYTRDVALVEGVNERRLRPAGHRHHPDLPGVAGHLRAGGGDDGGAPPARRAEEGAEDEGPGNERLPALAPGQPLTPGGCPPGAALHQTAAALHRGLPGEGPGGGGGGAPLHLRHGGHHHPGPGLRPGGHRDRGGSGQRPAESRGARPPSSPRTWGTRRATSWCSTSRASSTPPSRRRWRAPWTRSPAGAWPGRRCCTTSTPPSPRRWARPGRRAPPRRAPAGAARRGERPAGRPTAPGGAPRATAARGAGTCPQCGRPLVQRVSQFGPFLGCSGYPACRYVQREPGRPRAARRRRRRQPPGAPAVQSSPPRPDTPPAPAARTRLSRQTSRGGQQRSHSRRRARRAGRCAGRRAVSRKLQAPLLVPEGDLARRRLAEATGTEAVQPVPRNEAHARHLVRHEDHLPHRA